MPKLLKAADLVFGRFGGWVGVVGVEEVDGGPASALGVAAVEVGIVLRSQIFQEGFDI